ncbi:unnamed protein product [Closterium sp. NIES-64]|nr:unnamed protein product [Closterium sp. NIES-64]
MDLGVAHFHLVDEPRLPLQGQTGQLELFTPPPQQQQQQQHQQQQSPSAAASAVVSPLKENYKKKLAESFLSPSPGKGPSHRVKSAGGAGRCGGSGGGSMCGSGSASGRGAGGAGLGSEDSGEGSPVGRKIFAFFGSDSGGGSSTSLLTERATNLPLLGPVLLPESPSSTPARRLRQISLASERILDAPEIVDDYYLNLLDWSSQNQIAVALGTTVYLWSATSGDIHQLVHADGPDDYVTSVAWAKDGRHLAVGLNSSELQIWDASRLRQVRRLQGHRARVGSLAWNGHTLSSGSRDSSILNHDVRVRDHVVSALRAHEQEVCGLKWSRSGQHLASGGNDNLLYIWDNAAISSSSTSSFSSSSSFPISGNSSFHSSLSSSFSSLSSLSASSSLPPLLHSSASFSPFASFSSATAAAAASPFTGSSLIASLASSSSSSLPSAASLASLLASSPSPYASPFASPHSSLSFAPSHPTMPAATTATAPAADSAHAATGGAGTAAAAAAAAAGHSFLSLTTSSSSPPPPSLFSSPSASSSPRASSLAPSLSSHRSRASPNNVRYLHRLTAHQAAVKALAWCPFQSHLLASGGGTADRCIKFWNTQTGALTHSIDTHSQVCALEWSRHEKEILSSHGYSLNQLCLWRYPSMAKLAEFTGHTARVLHLAQSPDGYTVVSAAADETLRFWNAFGDPDGDKKGGKGGGRGCERRIGGGGGVAACDEDGVASARCSLLRSHIR